MAVKRTHAQSLHDLAIQQAGVEHNDAECAFCSGEGAETDKPEDQVSKTYTEAEYTAAVEEAVAKATAELTARMAQLEASTKQAEVDTAVEAAVAEVKEQLAEVQKQLDAAVAEAKTEREAREAIETQIADAAAEEARLAEVAKVMAERTAAVEATNAFDAEYVEKNADRWASMTAEEFADRLDEYTVIGARAGIKPAGDIPRKTAMTAGAGDGDKSKVKPRVTSVTVGLLEATRPGWKPAEDK